MAKKPLPRSLRSVSPVTTSPALPTSIGDFTALPEAQILESFRAHGTAFFEHLLRNNPAELRAWYALLLGTKTATNSLGHGNVINVMNAIPPSPLDGVPEHFNIRD